MSLVSLTFEACLFFLFTAIIASFFFKFYAIHKFIFYAIHHTLLAYGCPAAAWFFHNKSHEGRASNIFLQKVL